MTTKKKKPERWSYTAGERGYRVTVYENGPGAVIYRSVWDPKLRNGKGGQRRKSLKHRDRDEAVKHAKKLSAKLVLKTDEVRRGNLTLARLFAKYDQEEITRQRPRHQKASRRRVELFTRFLGPKKDPAKITLSEWNRFIDHRRSGEIDARGQRVDEDKREPVRDRSIEADLRFLIAVLNWATKWQDREGRYLMRENPVRGYNVPMERNPHRPVQTQERHEALLAVADQVTYGVVQKREGDKKAKRYQVRSYLRELLMLANGTGRRLSSILGLTYEDVNTERRTHAPYGSITWRDDRDKEGVEWKNVPMFPEARAALDLIMTKRPGIGPAPLFPSPKNLSEPMDRHLADKWLREAEELAGLTSQKGGLWHPYRRKAATELKGFPDKDVMQLQGWKDPRSLKQAYQHADAEGMLAAIEGRREYREASG
jgi:integrase